MFLAGQAVVLQMSQLSSVCTVPSLNDFKDPVHIRTIEGVLSSMCQWTIFTIDVVIGEIAVVV